MSLTARILRRVRTAIADDQVRYICFALDHVAANDHRRSVQQACVKLKDHFKAGLGSCNSLGEYLVDRGLPVSHHTLTLARLAWIDRTLETLQ